MSRIIIICTIAGILAVPAKALDGTPLSPNTVPTFKAAPLDLPPDLMAQAPNPASGQGVDPLIGTWKLNLEKSTGAIGFKSLTLTRTGEGQNFVDTADGVTAQASSSTPYFGIYTMDNLIQRRVAQIMSHPATRESATR